MNTDRDLWYHEGEQRSSSAFYRVQRLKLAPFKQHEKAWPKAKVKSNPFGYGRMGDYELDYMGSAEFEFGSCALANNRLAAAKKGLIIAEWSYEGHNFDFLWIEKEGEPFEAWTQWAKGNDRQPPFDGKEPPYELRKRLDGDDPPEYNDGEWQTAIWWALNANVLWAFTEDGHLHRWIESMGTAPTEFLR